MSNKPIVSIVCVAYNHEKFIQQTLESFIMQKANFDFEIIIGEDCSTDKTREIIKEFEKKYPNVIKPIFREKNIGTTENFFDTLRCANGKYIVICDGDDFFIDINNGVLIFQTKHDVLAWAVNIGIKQPHFFTLGGQGTGQIGSYS